MYAATATPPRSRPVVQRLLIGSWSYRHPRLSVGVRVTAGIWDLLLGIFLLAHGLLLGLIPLAGTALLFWVAYTVSHDVLAPARRR